MSLGSNPTRPAVYTFWLCNPGSEVRMRSQVPILLLATAAVLPPGLPAQADAQTVTLDEGVFRVFVGGREAGTERFSIRQTGTGASAIVIAQGRIVLEAGGQELATDLQASGPALRPTAYQVQVRGQQSQRIAARLVGGRFSATIVSPAGEMMREYLASDGAVILDEDVAHQHYFLARRVNGGASRLSVIIPRENRQLSAEVTTAGSEAIEIGGQRVQARHLVVRLAGGPERHLWVDDQARVLRLEVPARSYRAERTALPR